MGEAIEKARKVKARNDKKRLKVTLEKIQVIQTLIDKQDATITQACRKVGLSVDKYYRTLKKLKD